MYTDCVIARTLSQDAVVQAGVELVRRQGFSALGIRALAARLEVTPMALYRHVPHGDGLAAAVVEQLLAALPRVPGQGTLRARLRGWATAARAALREYPGFSHYLLLHWFELPAALQTVEELLAACEELGFTGFEAVASANALFTYVIMRVELEESLRGASAMKRKLAGLARSKVPLPRIAANAAEYEVAKVDAHFEFGLELLLDGLARRKRR
jgi:AcrR family transcriptional regulator